VGIAQVLHEIRYQIAETVTEPAWHETSSLTALRDLLAAGATLRHAVARRAGLSTSELAALERLSHGPQGPAALARELDVSTAAATGIVDRLTARGHAERVPHVSDRRRTEVHATDSGRTEMARQLLPMFERLVRLEASYSPDELAIVTRYLRDALAAVLAAVDEEAPQD
jgi:DNA-binding MarR family transcriptional regulator